jgi:hypothetical protein
LRNHSCSGEAINVINSDCVSVTLGIQHVNRMHRFMLSAVASPAVAYFSSLLYKRSGPGSSVGTATGRSGDRIPVGAKFFAHVQTGPGAHPASCTMGNGSFPGVKRPGRGADQPPSSSAEVENE